MTTVKNILLELEPKRLTNIMNVENIDLIPEELRISIQTVSGRPKNYYYANENEYNLAVKQFIPYMWDAEEKDYYQYRSDVINKGHTIKIMDTPIKRSF